MAAFGTSSRKNSQFARSVVVYYGESKGELRLTMRTALSREGFEGIQDFSRLEELRSAILTKAPDLIVIDGDLQDEQGGCPELIRDLRYHRLGDNPFIPVIATVWSPSQAFARELVDCGPDDLLIKPFSPGKLLERIQVLVERRKPFIVTSDYIGPDRRKDPTRGSGDVNFLEVPNTLGAKLKGEKVDPDAIKKAVETAQSDINEMKMQRNAFQISFLVEFIKPRLEAGDVSEEVVGSIKRLRRTAKDTGARLKNTKFSHISELCESMISVSGSLLESGDQPIAKDISLLKPVSDAILLAFNPESDAATMAGQISQAVSSYKRRVGGK